MATTANEKSLETTVDSNWTEIEKQEITSREIFDIDGKKVFLTNIERTVWDGIPKAKLIQYYHSIAPYILP